MNLPTVQLWDRFRALPRAAQWAAWAGAATVVTLVWSGPIMVRTSEWNARADRMLARIAEGKKGLTAVELHSESSDG